MSATWLALALLPGGEEAWFTDVTERALPSVTFQCGAVEKDWILEVNGGGIGLSDLDGDGHLDLVVVDCGDVEAYRRGEPGPAPRVFLNRGDGTFRPGEGAWVIERGPAPSFGAGLALGDLDGDGFDDRRAHADRFTPRTPQRTARTTPLYAASGRRRGVGRGSDRERRGGAWLGVGLGREERRVSPTATWTFTAD